MAASQAGPQGAMKKSNAGDEAFSQDPDKVFNECPDMLYHSNLLVVAKKYTTKQIAERDTKILQKTRPQATVKSNTIVARIKSACNSMAKEKGVSPKSFRQEFDMERSKIEGALIPYSLRTFKFVPTTPLPDDPKSFDDLKAYKKEIDDKNLSHPPQFAVKVYTVYQNYLKEHHYDFDKALDEVLRVYEFKSKDSAYNFITNVTKAALDRNGNLVNWKTAAGLNKGKARATDINKNASLSSVQGTIPTSTTQTNAAVWASPSAQDAGRTSMQDSKTQPRPQVFEFAANAGVLGRPTPSTRLVPHLNPQPLPRLFQQYAPSWGQPTVPHPQAQVPIYGALSTTLPAAAIPTADYPAAQPAFTFRRHGTNPISATSACIPNVPTPSGAIVSPSVLHDASSEDVQLRDAPATHVGRKLPGKTVYGKRIISADLLGYRLMAFLKVLDDPDHVHNEDFDFNTFAHIITVDEASDLQETVKDITEFHKHLETKTGDLRSRYTDEQVRKVAVNAVRHFLDFEYEKGAYFIEYFLSVLAKFDELVEPAPAQQKEIQVENEGGGADQDGMERGDGDVVAGSQEMADSMDMDEADEVTAVADGGGGADVQDETVVGGDYGGDPMVIDEA